jgi:hypothetical protein
MAQQAMNVVIALKKIVLPITWPSSDDVEKMKEELATLEANFNYISFFTTFKITAVDN